MGDWTPRRLGTERRAGSSKDKGLLHECPGPVLSGFSALGDPESLQPWQKKPFSPACLRSGLGVGKASRGQHMDPHAPCLAFLVDPAGDVSLAIICHPQHHGSLWRSPTQDHSGVEWGRSHLANKSFWQRVSNSASICWASIMCEA